MRFQDVPTFDITASSGYASPNSNYVGQFTITRTGGVDNSNSITAKLAVGGTAPGTDFTTLFGFAILEQHDVLPL